MVVVVRIVVVVAPVKLKICDTTATHCDNVVLMVVEVVVCQK